MLTCDSSFSHYMILLQFPLLLHTFTTSFICPLVRPCIYSVIHLLFHPLFVSYLIYLFSPIQSSHPYLFLSLPSLFPSSLPPTLPSSLPIFLPSSFPPPPLSPSLPPFPSFFLSYFLPPPACPGVHLPASIRGAIS